MYVCILGAVEEWLCVLAVIIFVNAMWCGVDWCGCLDFEVCVVVCATSVCSVVLWCVSGNRLCVLW